MQNGQLKNQNWRNKFDLIFPVILIYELVLGGSGRVITFGGGISLRYVLFGISILYYIFIWINDLIKNKKTLAEVINLRMNKTLVIGLFFILLLFASITRGIIKYPISDVILSSKGFLFIFMIFPFTYFIDTPEKARKLLKSFTNASVILAAVSFAIFLIFGLNNESYNVIEPILSKWSYGYIALRNGFPAVFMKTSPYIAISLIIELGLYINSKSDKNKLQMFRIFILLEAVICTMSMGIWISTLVGFGSVIILSVANRKYIRENMTRTIFLDLLPMIMMVIITQVVFNYMFSDYIVEVIDNRISTNDSSFVVKADQLHQLTEIWKQNVMFGKGFGHRIYFSLGEFREESMVIFELFWNQLLLNMGLLGFASYVLFITQPIFSYINGMIKRYYEVEDMIIVTLMSIGMLMMCIVSSVNPFMNNPIGIGYLGIFIGSLNVFIATKKSVDIKKKSFNQTISQEMV